MFDKCISLAMVRPRVSKQVAKQRSGDKCKSMRPSVSRVGRNKWKTSGDKWETNVEASGQEYLSRETSKETSRDKCKNIRPSVSRVGRDKWETSVYNKNGKKQGDKWETRVKSSGQEHLSRDRDNWKTSVTSVESPRVGRQVGDKCKNMWPRAPSGRQVQNHVPSGRQVQNHVAQSTEQI